MLREMGVARGFLQGALLWQKRKRLLCQTSERMQRAW